MSLYENNLHQQKGGVGSSSWPTLKRCQYAFQIVTDSSIKGLAGCAWGLLLDPSFKEVPTSSDSWKEAGITKYIPLSELFSNLGTYIVGSFRKGRLIYGVASSAVIYILKTVKSPEDNMVNEDFELPWPWYNVLVFVLCICFSWKTAKQIICSAFREQS